MKSTGIRSRYVRSGVRVFARDDGRFANSTLKQWLDQLASGKGLCFHSRLLFVCYGR